MRARLTRFLESAPKAPTPTIIDLRDQPTAEAAGHPDRPRPQQNGSAEQSLELLRSFVASMAVRLEKAREAEKAEEAERRVAAPPPRLAQAQVLLDAARAFADKVMEVAEESATQLVRDAASHRAPSSPVSAPPHTDRPELGSEEKGHLEEEIDDLNSRSEELIGIVESTSRWRWVQSATRDS